MEIIRQYFPETNTRQWAQFSELQRLYSHWNAQINLISRKDIENLYERHVVHSLAINKFFQFKPATLVLDLGTGGGFPGIPLAILNPQVQFILVDSIQKKIKVCKAITESLGLENVVCIADRVENLDLKPDIIVSRAVAEINQIFNWTAKFAKSKPDLKYLLLKGGDVNAEIQAIRNPVINFREIRTYEISNVFHEAFFKGKYVIFIPLIKQ